MSTNISTAPRASRWPWVVAAAVLTVATIGLAISWKQIQERLAALAPQTPKDEHSHDGHAHGADASDSLTLTEQARKNIGLKTEPIALRPFTRTISIPAMVVERPGRSVVEITTPMTGIVTEIHPLEGESIAPGQKLFDLRLTHEEIVQAQADLLRTTEELDVVAREIERLEKVTADGALPGKALLERQYEQQKLQAAQRAQKQALLLHGLSQAEVDGILKSRALLQSVSIEAPAAKVDALTGAQPTKWQIQSLKVAQGQHVDAGASMAVLIDYSVLFLEGNAFARDAAAIQTAARDAVDLTIVDESAGGTVAEATKLKILYLAPKVDPETRTLHFYATLPNTHEAAEKQGAGRFATWKYRPGQRMQVLVPVGNWPEGIVLPQEAIAQDGIETFVFVANGKKFNRRAVHVEYRGTGLIGSGDKSSQKQPPKKDPARETQWVVIANDGSLFPGEEVAINSAQQLQLAIKNRAAAPVDPHAGHNH